MSIRIRLAILFMVATAATIAVGSLVYLSVLTHELHATIDSGLDLQSQDVASALQQQGSTPSAALRAAASLRSQDMAQIIGADGTVLAASPTDARIPFLSASQLARAREGRTTLDVQVTIPGLTGGDRVHVRFQASSVARPEGTAIVVVGTSLEWTDDAIDHVTDTVFWAGPIVVALAGLAAWLLAGGALRPVERMRRQAASISADGVPFSQPPIAVPATRDEIAALAQTMNDLLSRLQEALVRERSFVADAGHEMRTPLAILCAELELASRPGRDLQELRGAVFHAAEESQRLSRLASDLLLLARNDVAGSNLRRDPTVVESVIRAATAAKADQAAEHGITITTDVPPDLVADVNPDRVRRLIDNLLDNALQWTPTGGVIHVAAASAGTRLRIEVLDSGPGFPADFLPHAFERFRRADASRTRNTGGAGLGLAIVRSIAQAHGGTVEAHNRIEGGARVVVELEDAILTDSAIPEDWLDPPATGYSDTTHAPTENDPLLVTSSGPEVAARAASGIEAERDRPGGERHP